MSAINKIFIVILFFFISFGYAVRGHNYVVSGDYVYEGKEGLHHLQLLCKKSRCTYSFRSHGHGR